MKKETTNQLKARTIDSLALAYLYTSTPDAWEIVADLRNIDECVHCVALGMGWSYGTCTPIGGLRAAWGDEFFFKGPHTVTVEYRALKTETGYQLLKMTESAFSKYMDQILSIRSVL